MQHHFFYTQFLNEATIKCLTSLLQLVGDNATHEMRVSHVQVLHELVQLLLFTAVTEKLSNITYNQYDTIASIDIQPI